MCERDSSFSLSFLLHLVFEDILGVCESFQDSLLTYDLRNVADRSANRVACHGVAEKEEDIFVLVAEVRLLILLIQVDGTSFVQL